jgi:hypothetical protein
MKVPCHLLGVSFALVFLVSSAPRVFGQDADLTRAVPHYARRGPIDISKIPVLPAGASISGLALSANAEGRISSLPTFGAASNGFGVQSPLLFGGGFVAQGGPSVGTVFPYIMMGRNPLAGGTTVIPVRITEVSLQLLNANGSVRLNVPYAPFEVLVNNSPNFEEAHYTSSGSDTQFGDAVQRAEFFNMMAEDWHTLLSEPQIVNRVTFTLPRFVNAQFSDGSTHSVRSYFVGTAADGNPFVLMLDQLFIALFSNQVNNDINANNFTTDAMNFSLFPNTFLFSVNENDPTTPGPCCTLGFHAYALDSSQPIPQPSWLATFASYISPGIFKNPSVLDVTAVSHEISEALNDPFGSNPVPVWQFPIPGLPPTAQVCQGNLETGDPVEVLPTSSVPINIRERHQTFVYHPQTEALLQWFQMGSTSNAIGGAFSYPDTSALTQSARPCPQ